ncbi:hypothetical protein BDR06DRAFT_976555 [Suillus hirtellus]|nr:hypothetical protein BDR06DRAFT_976555 [Suillus hirtellus]
MHRFFEFDDIIHVVLQHVKSSPTDLVNVAMTCSRLAGPALNILWSEQHSLAPLIMCLPEDAWEVTEDHTINLSREPTPIEWERLRINASRVRRLLTDDCEPLELQPSGRVLQRLFERFPPVILFPNLFELDFEAAFGFLECSSKVLLLRQFLSPRLEALAFDVAGLPTHEVEQLLAALSAEAYGLRQMMILADGGAKTVTVLPSLGKLPKLTQLAIFAIDTCLTKQTINNIQQAQRLQSLNISLRGTSCDAGDIPFELPSLEILRLFGDSLPQCTHFLRQVTTRQLQLIDVCYYKPARPTEISAFIESLSTLCQNFRSLKQLYLVDSSIVNGDEPAVPLPSQIFRPLFKFTELASVVFLGIGDYNLDDRFINDVAVAWPLIQDLKFTASRRRAGCNVTFSAVMSLASKCRLLQFLHLTCDATQATIAPRAPDGTTQFWPTQTSLCNLHLGYSEMSQVSGVPYYLAEVFPTLSHFYWYRNTGDFGIEILMEAALEVARQELRAVRGLNAL